MHWKVPAIAGLALTFAGTAFLYVDIFRRGDWLSKRARRALDLESDDPYDVRVAITRGAREGGDPGPWHVAERWARFRWSVVGLSLLGAGFLLEFVALLMSP